MRRSSNRNYLANTLNELYELKLPVFITLAESDQYYGGK